MPRCVEPPRVLPATALVHEVRTHCVTTSTEPIITVAAAPRNVHTVSVHPARSGVPARACVGLVQPTITRLGVTLGLAE